MLGVRVGREFCSGGASSGQYPEWDKLSWRKSALDGLFALFYALFLALPCVKVCSLRVGELFVYFFKIPFLPTIATEQTVAKAVGELKRKGKKHCFSFVGFCTIIWFCCFVTPFS